MCLLRDLHTVPMFHGSADYIDFNNESNIGGADDGAADIYIYIYIYVYIYIYIIAAMFVIISIMVTSTATPTETL